MQRPYRNWIRVHDSFSFVQLARSQCLVFVLFLQDIHNLFIGVCCPRPTGLIFGEQTQTTVFLWSDCTIVCSIWNGYRLHFQIYMDIILVSCWVGAVSKGLERRIVSCGPKHSVLQHSVPQGCPNRPTSCTYVFYGRDPFNQNFRKFRSKPQWIGSVQPEKFRKNGSIFWGGPLFPVGPVGILFEWIAPYESLEMRTKWDNHGNTRARATRD